MKKLKIGYFADGPWSHQAFNKLVQDPSIQFQFIVPRYDTKDSKLEELSKLHNIDYFKTKNINSQEFIDIISKNSINIDINGAAEVSCRTFDALGLQSALIRPKLNVKQHNELIPDYHYAALKCEDLGNWKEVADAYIERFEDLKKDLKWIHADQ